MPRPMTLDDFLSLSNDECDNLTELVLACYWPYKGQLQQNLKAFFNVYEKCRNLRSIHFYDHEESNLRRVVFPASQNDAQILSFIDGLLENKSLIHICGIDELNLTEQQKLIFNQRHLENIKRKADIKAEVESHLPEHLDLASLVAEFEMEHSDNFMLNDFTKSQLEVFLLPVAAQIVGGYITGLDNEDIGQARRGSLSDKGDLSDEEVPESSSSSSKKRKAEDSREGQKKLKS